MEQQGTKQDLTVEEKLSLLEQELRMAYARLAMAEQRLDQVMADLLMLRSRA